MYYLLERQQRRGGSLWCIQNIDTKNLRDVSEVDDGDDVPPEPDYVQGHSFSPLSMTSGIVIALAFSPGAVPASAVKLVKVDSPH